MAISLKNDGISNPSQIFPIFTIFLLYHSAALPLSHFAKAPLSNGDISQKWQNFKPMPVFQNFRIFSTQPLCHSAVLQKLLEYPFQTSARYSQSSQYFLLCHSAALPLSRFHSYLPFSSSGNLKTHYGFHRCSQCEKKFSQSQHLKTHERIHNYGKPFRSSECEKKFSR